MATAIWIPPARAVTLEQQKQQRALGLLGVDYLDYWMWDDFTESYPGWVAGASGGATLTLSGAVSSGVGGGFLEVTVPANGAIYLHRTNGLAGSTIPGGTGAEWYMGWRIKTGTRDAGNKTNILFGAYERVFTGGSDNLYMGMTSTTSNFVKAYAGASTTSLGATCANTTAYILEIWRTGGVTSFAVDGTVLNTDASAFTTNSLQPGAIILQEDGASDAYVCYIDWACYAVGPGLRIT